MARETKQPKTITIIVNGREKTVEKNDQISSQELR